MIGKNEEEYRMAGRNSEQERQFLKLITDGDLENKENIRLVAECLAVYIDAAEATSIELYEHYRKPVDLFRSGVRALARQTWWQEERFGTLDPEIRQLLAGSILKGCRLQVILQEKYQAAGEHIRDYSGAGEN